MQATENRTHRHMQSAGSRCRCPMQRSREGGKRLGNARPQGSYEDARHCNTAPIVEQHAQVVLSQRDHEIQALPPQRADEPLTQGVGLRTLWRRFHDS